MKFINYMMEPEVIAKCTNFTNYANGNSRPPTFVDKAISTTRRSIRTTD